MTKRRKEVERVEIYALAHPVSGEIRYIGKANDTRKRLATHLTDSRRSNRPVCCWIRKLASEGLVPIAVVIETVQVSAWKEAEIRQIREYRSTHRLLNLSDGGDAIYSSSDTQAENGRRAVKARTSTPVKRRVWELKRAVCDLLKRGYCTEAAKEKMRYAARKRPDLFGIWADV